MLILRVGFAGMLVPRGYNKLVHFKEMEKLMTNFLGIGQPLSLSLVIFSEFFCALFVLFGLFTRLACIPIIISMTVAAVKVHQGLIFGEGQHAAMYAVAFLILLLIGPGKISADGMMGK